MVAQIIQPSQIMSVKRERLRMALILGGIVVAAIVLIFLVKDVGSTFILDSVTASPKQAVLQAANTHVETFASAVTRFLNF